MLCDPPPANEEILPEASQGSYFFNRIDPKQPVSTGKKRPKAVIHKRLLPANSTVREKPISTQSDLSHVVAIDLRNSNSMLKSIG